ncbi:MAG: LacI family DNA-binding transcriptional regulator [Acidobacteriota bacterium]
MSSIKDIASEAGVSTATVSHVINKTRFVSEKVRTRVLEAIELHNYYPNAHARSLASGSSRIFGLVISDIANPFFPELVKNIETAAYEHGYDVVLSNTNYDAERASHYVRRFIERKVAGVALMTSEMDKSLIAELARCEVPVVFLDSGKTGLHMSNLRVRYAEGIKQAILHLVELGHTNVAFISGLENLHSAKRRLEAFTQTMREVLPNAKIRVYQGDFKIEGGKRAAAEMLRGELPTAVIAANDLMAFGAISEFRRAGLNVPVDISVVGFDNIAFSSLVEPALTTVNLPLGELGRMAVKALIETLANPTQHGVEIEIPTKLFIRNSTAAARKKVKGKNIKI